MFASYDILYSLLLRTWVCSDSHSGQHVYAHLISVCSKLEIRLFLLPCNKCYCQVVNVLTMLPFMHSAPRRRPKEEFMSVKVDSQVLLRYSVVTLALCISQYICSADLRFPSQNMRLRSTCQGPASGHLLETSLHAVTAQSICLGIHLESGWLVFSRLANCSTERRGRPL